jgi:hypothetical protein
MSYMFATGLAILGVVRKDPNAERDWSWAGQPAGLVKT